MNYGELKARLAADLHRSDLTVHLPFFVDQARERLERRFGIELAELLADVDTDEVLTHNPSLYRLAALGEAYRFLNDGENADTFDRLWNVECNRVNVSGLPGYTDPWTDADGNPPVITPEVRAS